MNDISFNLPWIEFILYMWLKDEFAEKGTNIRARAKSLGIITEDELFWHVDKDWFQSKLASDKEILNVKSSEDFAFLVLGISELMDRTTQYMTLDIVDYISKAPASDKIQECLLCIYNNAKAYFPASLDLSIETQGQLQFVNGVKATPKNFKSVDRLLGDGPRHIIRSDSYGLSGALTLLLKIDASAVGAWLQSQEHPLILDAALYALKHAYMMILSTGHEQEIFQLVCSKHPLIVLTGLVITHTAYLKEWHPIWSVPLGEAFKLLEHANISTEMSVWASLFRIAEISRAYGREKQRHQESKRHYAYASEGSNYLYGKKETHYENMERQVRQKDFLKDIATKSIYEITIRWPQTGLSKEVLNYCVEIISFDDIWLQFLAEIPSIEDKEYLVKSTLKKFIRVSDLFKHNERGHCYANELMFNDADFVAKAFFLLQHKDIGRDFGKLFFSDNTESLKFDDKILSEPYAYRKRFDGYNHAINALAIGHYIALQVGAYGNLQKNESAKFLLRKGTLGLIKVISAAQGDWDVADGALQTFSMVAIEFLSGNEHIFSDEELEPFLELPHLKYSFRSMIGLSNQKLFEQHSERIFSLLEKSLLPTAVWSAHYDRIISSFLAFDFALMRFAQLDDRATACRVCEIWEKGILAHTDPIPKPLDGAIVKMKAALFGDKQCCDWLINNPSLSNTWSSNYLKTLQA